ISDIIMSDFEHSTVTYTSVSFPVEDDSEIGSPRVDGPPIMPENPYAYIMAAYEIPPSLDYIPGPEVPPSPDYIPGPEEPQSPPPLDFVPEPMYPKYMPQEDEILPAEEQPQPAAVSPTADSPESDPEEEPEEDDEDPEEDLADYPADGDDDDEDEDEDEEEEDEHLALADSVPPVHYTITPSTIPSPPPNALLILRVPDSCFTSSEEGILLLPPLVPRCSTSRELDYGITDTWNDLVGAIDEIAPTIVEGVNQRVTDLVLLLRRRTTSMFGINGMLKLTFGLN
ncbi:hypothetical protein Tco_1445619, partial [Tanacetum coccineum]